MELIVTVYNIFYIWKWFQKKMKICLLEYNVFIAVTEYKR